MLYTAHHKNIKNAKGRNIHYEDGSRIRKYKIYMKKNPSDKDGYFVGDVVKNLDVKPEDRPYSLTLPGHIRDSGSEDFIDEIDARFETMSELKVCLNNNIRVPLGITKKREKEDDLGCAIFVFVVFVLIVIAAILT